MFSMSYQRSVRARVAKLFSVTVMCLFTMVLLNSYKVNVKPGFYGGDNKDSLWHDRLVAEFYGKRKGWKTSKLGSILYKNEQNPAEKNRTFVILIYKHWDWLQKRHLYNFGSTSHNPFEGCSVNNCVITGQDKDINTVDAVIVHLHKGIIPKVEHRNTTQRWIFLDDESPANTFALSKTKPKLSELANIFNWSMTYRSDADIPVPYGRTVALNISEKATRSLTHIIPNWKQKRRDVLVTMLISNCGVSFRNQLTSSVKDYIRVHMYGKCGDADLKKSCPGHFKSDCQEISKYLFYLVIENGKCKEYMTEKLFYNAYSKGAIPVIQGPSLDECKRLLPPNSFIHFDSYPHVFDLVKDLKQISQDELQLLSYHRWRLDFKVLNEHGYFGSKSYHLCRVCQALNYNDEKESIYTKRDLKKFLDPVALCRK